MGGGGAVSVTGMYRIGSNAHSLAFESVKNSMSIESAVSALLGAPPGAVCKLPYPNQLMNLVGNEIDYTIDFACFA